MCCDPGKRGAQELRRKGLTGERPVNPRMLLPIARLLTRFISRLPSTTWCPRIENNHAFTKLRFGASGRTPIRPMLARSAKVPEHTDVSEEPEDPPLPWTPQLARECARSDSWSTGRSRVGRGERSRPSSRRRLLASARSGSDDHAGGTRSRSDRDGSA
jgi:hypothetical protein